MTSSRMAKKTYIYIFSSEHIKLWYFPQTPNSFHVITFISSPIIDNYSKFESRLDNNTEWVLQVEPGSGRGEAVEGITHQLVNIGGEPQMLQVLSIKDSAALTKALAQHNSSSIKIEEAPTITSD